MHRLSFWKGLTPFCRFRDEGDNTGDGGNSDGGGAGGTGNGAPGGQTGNGGTGTGDGTTPKTYSEEEVKALRAEAANYRVQLREAQGKVKTFEDAKLSDEEKTKNAIAEAQAELARTKSELRSTAILAAAATAKATVPEAVVGLVPADAQTKEEIAAAVASLKTQFPQLFTAKTGGGGDGSDGTGGGGSKPKISMNDIIRKAAGRSF